MQKLNPYSVSLTLGICVLSALLGYLFLDMHRDEAMIGEHAYWFSQNFSVKSTLARGLNLDWENKLLHYHKLLVYGGAWFTSLFGFKLHIIRIVPLVTYLALMLAFFKYLSAKYGSQNKWIVVALVLLFFNYQFYASGLVFRPEILVAFFGFISFVQLEKFRKSKSGLSLILASLFVALAALSHLNGLAFGGAGLLYVLAVSNWRKGFQFTFLAIFFFIPYFWDLWSIEKLQTWMHTIADDPNLGHQQNIILQLIVRLAEEHMRWFRNPQMAWFFLAFFLSLLASGKAFWKKNTPLLVYTLTLLLMVAVLSYSKSTKYTVIYYPYMVLLMVAAAKNELSKTKRKTLRRVYLSGFLALNFAYAYFAFDRTALDVLRQNERLETIVSNQKAHNLLADESFIFSSIGRFNLHMPYVYALQFDGVEKPNELQSFLSFAHNNNDDLVIIDEMRSGKNFYKKLHLENVTLGQVVGNYQLIVAEKGWHVFKHK